MITENEKWSSFFDFLPSVQFNLIFTLGKNIALTFLLTNLSIYTIYFYRILVEKYYHDGIELLFFRNQ